MTRNLYKKKGFLAILRAKLQRILFLKFEVGTYNFKSYYVLTIKVLRLFQKPLTDVNFMIQILIIVFVLAFGSDLKP